MKRFLLSFLIPLILSSCAVAPLRGEDSLAKQTRHCQKVLWYEQKQFELDQVYMTVQVKHPATMTDHYAWGTVHLEPGGPVIEIMAMEDYPAAMSVKERRHQQDEIVVHEVLHILLIKAGVPTENQDPIIEAVRPGVRVP